MKLLIECRSKTRIPLGMMAQLRSAPPLSGCAGRETGARASDEQCFFAVVWLSGGLAGSTRFVMHAVLVGQ
jgi:hypothetical protein